MRAIFSYPAAAALLIAAGPVSKAEERQPDAGQAKAAPASPKPREASSRPSGPTRINAISGGWARYLADTDSGHQLYVVRVGESATVEGRAGRWLRTEYEIEKVGRIGVESLFVGPYLEPKALRRVRLIGPWPDTKQSQTKVDPISTLPPTPHAVLVHKGQEEIAGRKITVEEYEHEDGSYTAWSPDVPGLGIVRQAGTTQTMLVAFGVGGDPWAGASQDLAKSLRPRLGPELKK